MKCIETGWISSEGPFVAQFESEFAKYVGREYGIALSNGTAALEVAIKALDIKQGDEVILPTFSIISCAGAVFKSGAYPVLVDCEPSTWNMNLDEVEAKITPQTKAILVVHTYGLPVDMERVQNIADRHNLRIIEDAAEMHGQEIRGRRCGSFGDLSVFSFYPNKHITTGEGGMVVTNCPKLARRCAQARDLFFAPPRRFVHEELGWNYRMTNMQAAIGVAQLENIENAIRKKRKIGLYYHESLKDISSIEIPRQRTDFSDNIYWVFGIILGGKYSFDASFAISELEKRGVGTRPFFWCVHEQPVFRKMGFYKNEHYPVAENMARRGFYLPSGLGLKPEEQEYVCGQVKSFFRAS